MKTTIFEALHTSQGWTFQVKRNAIATKKIDIDKVFAGEFVVYAQYTPALIQQYAQGNISDLIGLQINQGVGDVIITSESMPLPVTDNDATDLSVALARLVGSPIPLLGGIYQARGNNIQVKTFLKTGADLPNDLEPKISLAITPGRLSRARQVTRTTLLDGIDTVIPLKPFAKRLRMTFSFDGGLAGGFIASGMSLPDLFFAGPSASLVQPAFNPGTGVTLFSFFKPQFATGSEPWQSDWIPIPPDAISIVAKVEFSGAYLTLEQEYDA